MVAMVEPRRLRCDYSDSKASLNNTENLTSLIFVLIEKGNEKGKKISQN